MRSKFTLTSSTAVVIANMIGVGVFGSLGFQLLGITDYAAIIFLWILGGIISLFGSFAYAELSSCLPRSGGEYNFLSQIFHPYFGFLAGWVSATIGFAAPVAAAAALFANYLRTVFPAIPRDGAGIGIILVITIIHSTNYKTGGSFQSWATFLKIALIVFFVGAGLGMANPQHVSFLPTSDTLTQIFSSSFALSLAFISYAYSGWNASTYFASEINNPKKNIPLSLITGTAIVTVLYVFLNYTFLHAAPYNDLKVVFDANGNPMHTASGAIAANYIFGNEGGRIISIIIGMLLISSISSMIIAGPRVIQVIGQDIPFFKIFSKTNPPGIPIYAIAFQSVISIALFLSGSFDSIITYTAFTLALFTTATVAGVIVLRIKHPEMYRTYKTWGYPVTPVLFIAANCWFLFVVLRDKTSQSIVGLSILIIGTIVYLLLPKKERTSTS